MKKTTLSLLALVLVFSLALTGCGGQKAEETTSAAPAETLAAGQPLELTSWNLTAATWSSPNGATVNLTATPNGYAEGQSAAFIVRLEGADVENVPCSWDGSAYTASADLNAADGYCYYVLLTAADGTQTEVAVNTPTAMIDEALINMATALQSYCSLTVSASSQDGDQLTIGEGNVTIQLPLITNEGESIVCDKAVLVMTSDGEEVGTAELELEDAPDAGTYTLSIAGTTFTVPQLEDDHRVELRLDVTLSNDQTLTAMGGSWIYSDGKLLLAAG